MLIKIGQKKVNTDVKRSNYKKRAFMLMQIWRS